MRRLSTISRIILGALALIQSVAYATDGELDSLSFAGNGYLSVPFGDTEISTAASTVLVQSDGKYVLAGTVSPAVMFHPSYNESVGLVRVISSSGALDPGFGNAGKVTLDTGYTFSEAVLDSSQRIWVAEAYSRRDSSSPDRVVRLLPNGNIDPGFGSAGVALLPNTGMGYFRVAAIALQSNGKLIVAGDYSGNLAALRINIDGSLDTSFATAANGIAQSHVSANGNDAATAVAIQPDGSVVVAGVVTSAAPHYQDFGVVRFTPNGALDTSFNTAGNGSPAGTQTMSLDLCGSPPDSFANNDIPNVVLVRPNGRIVMVGRATGCSSADTADKVAVAQLLTNGTPDTGFYANGVRAFDYDDNMVMPVSETDFAYAAGLQSDGSLVIAGHRVLQNSTEPNIAVARLTASGARDTNFVVVGQETHPGAVIYDFPGAEGAYGLTFDAGRPVLAGYDTTTSGMSTIYNFLVARLANDLIFTGRFED